MGRRRCRASGWAVRRKRLMRARWPMHFEAQSLEFGAGAAWRSRTLEKLRAGARAVVTGQQVGLFGGPLLTILKAATAVARARGATAKTGVEHVPVFWLATEDHDLAEVDQVALLSKSAVETLRVGLTSHGEPVGGVKLGAGVEAVLDQAGELLQFAPIWDWLRECYTPEATLGGAFARLMTTHLQRAGFGGDGCGGAGVSPAGCDYAASGGLAGCLAGRGFAGEGRRSWRLRAITRRCW